jgi:hypothetical protein
VSGVQKNPPRGSPPPPENRGEHQRPKCAGSRAITTTVSRRSTRAPFGSAEPAMASDPMRGSACAETDYLRQSHTSNRQRGTTGTLQLLARGRNLATSPHSIGSRPLVQLSPLLSGSNRLAVPVVVRRIESCLRSGPVWPPASGRRTSSVGQEKLEACALVDGLRGSAQLKGALSCVDPKERSD